MARVAITFEGPEATPEARKAKQRQPALSFSALESPKELTGRGRDRASRRSSQGQARAAHWLAGCVVLAVDQVLRSTRSEAPEAVLVAHFPGRSLISLSPGLASLVSLR